MVVLSAAPMPWWTAGFQDLLAAYSLVCLCVVSHRPVFSLKKRWISAERDLGGTLPVRSTSLRDVWEQLKCTAHRSQSCGFVSIIYPLPPVCFSSALFSMKAAVVVKPVFLWKYFLRIVLHQIGGPPT